MFQKMLVDLCGVAVCHLLVFGWMRGLPLWEELLLFVAVPILASLLLLRPEPKPMTMPHGLVLAFQMEIGQLRIMVVYGGRDRRLMEGRRSICDAK